MEHVTFLTGASSGIGRALALRMAKGGSAVALVARRLDQLEEVASQIRATGGSALPIACDVSKRQEVHTAVQRCEKELGVIDCLIAAAGIGGVTGPEKFDGAEVERIIQTDLLGPVYCIEAIMPGMISRKNGHIVGISSLAAFRGLPNAAAYSASKAGLNALLESLRVGLRRYNVSVTTICPAFVKTPMTAGSRNPMPFLMELEDAVDKIYQAIRRKRRTYLFPWQMAAIMKAVQFLPDALYDRGAGVKLKK